MELELERGPGCSDLHQVRCICKERGAWSEDQVPFGAILWPALALNMAISTAALQGRGTGLCE